MTYQFIFKGSGRDESGFNNMKKRIIEKVSFQSIRIVKTGEKAQISI